MNEPQSKPAQAKGLPTSYWFLWTAQTLSQFGNMVQWIAIPLWVAAVTGSPVAAGLTFAVEVLPIVVLAPWAGYLADRFDRTRLIMVCETLSALGVLVILLGVRMEALPLVYSAIAITKVFNTVSMPAGQAIIKARVPVDQIKKAVGWYQASTGAMATIGTASGVAIAAAFGVEAVLYANAASFLASALLTAFVGRCRPASRLSGSVAAATGQAVRALLGNRALTGAAAAEALYFLCFSGTMTVTVLYITATIGESFSGLYPSGTGLGFFLISLLVVKRHGDRARTLIVSGLATCAPLGLLIWLLADVNPVLAFALGFVSGAANVMVGGGASVTYQRETPEAVAGRVFGLRRAATNLSIGASHVAVSALSVLIGFGQAITVAGLLTCVFGLAALWLITRTEAGEAVAADAEVTTVASGGRS